MTSHKKTKQPKRFTRRARKTGQRPRNAVPMMSGAPAGVSQDLQQEVRFLPTRGGRGINMRVCVPIYTILASEGSTTSLGGSALKTINQTSVGSAQLNLTGPLGLALSSGNGVVITAPYTSPVFDLIGSSFVRYKVSKLRFDYEPQSSSTADGRLVFAFANDPHHPTIWNSDFPNQQRLLSLSDSIAFAPWRSWSMDVSSRLSRNTEYYIFSGASAGESLTSAEERFSDFGAISCLTTKGTSSSDQVGGVLYMSMDCELVEFCPISTTRPTMFSHLLKKFEATDMSAFHYGKPKLLTNEEEEVLTNKSKASTISGESESDQELMDYHLSMQAKVTHPVIGDGYRSHKHKLKLQEPGITGSDPDTSDEAAAIKKMTASSIEISRLKSQLDQLNHSKTS